MSETELWKRVLEAADHARSLEAAGFDCTRADEAYMDALFAYHDRAASPNQSEGASK